MYGVLFARGKAARADDSPPTIAEVKNACTPPPTVSIGEEVLLAGIGEEKILDPTETRTPTPLSSSP
jgi:hypothetical protein